MQILISQVHIKEILFVWGFFKLQFTINTFFLKTSSDFLYKNKNHSFLRKKKFKAIESVIC